MSPRRLAVSVALALGVVVGGAPAASAHAILLRTDPSPQTIVARPPSAVRLHFSEAVEVAFGAVRVFDVDGHPADAGSPRRGPDHRDVSVPVRLHDGTYTVTWRVTSADGHAVRGGFVFYVGAPSTISAAAVPSEKGAGRLATWGYGAVRFAWFGAFAVAVGLVVTRRWVWTPTLRAAGLGDSDVMESSRGRFRRTLPLAWIVLTVAGALTLVFQAATVSGRPLPAAFRPSVLSGVLSTTFGHLWLAEMVLTLAGAVPVVALVRRRRTLGVGPTTWIVVLGALVVTMAAVAALNGHARTLGHPAAGVASVALHLLAVAVWVGGLAALVVLGARGWRQLPEGQRPPVVRGAVERFTRVAVWSVAVLLLSGVVNTVLDLGAVSDLWRTAYGRVVVAKVVLLCGALLLAARHRWVVPRRLAAPDTARRAARAFAGSAAAELAVLAGVVALASALVALVPGRSLALAAQGPVNVERRAGPYTVQLIVDPSKVGANQVHVTFVDARGLAAAEIAQTDVSLGPRGAAPQPLDMRLISPGHFVADATLAAPGAYRVSVSGGGGAPTATTFQFRVRGANQR